MRSFVLVSSTWLGLAAGCAGVDVASGERPDVRFSQTGGDVWAFEASVRGEVRGACSSLEVGPPGRERGVELEDGKFEALVPLEPGENVVHARCRVAGKVRAQAEPIVLHGRTVDRPHARAKVTLDGEALSLDARSSTASERGREPIVAYRWSVRRAGVPVGESRTLGDGEVMRVGAPEEDGLHRFELEVEDEAGRRDQAAVLISVERGRARVVGDDEPPPWAEHAVVYGASPSLLGDAPFRKLEARLDHLKRLGVTALWIAPIHPSAPDDEYGYAVEDHFGVRQSFGSDADLRALVTAAHARGMRVLLDMVPNHTSDTHAYFEGARREGVRSRYFDYYERDERGGHRYFFDWAHLPNLDYRHPEVRRMAQEIFVHWVREIGIDGFRVDVAWGIARRDPTFFPSLRAELRRIEPELLLIAEASARDPRAHQGFDAAYDWTEHPGRWAWQDAFPADGELDLLALDEALFGEAAEGPLTVRFLNNNDTGARFVTRHGLGRTRVATALLFTLPGVPALFMGDEVAAEFHPYEQVEPLRFPDAPDVVEAHRKLVELRKRYPVLRKGALVQVPVSHHDRVFAHLRATPGERSLVVLLNFGDEAIDAEIELPKGHDDALGPRVRDVLNGRPRVLRRKGARYVVHLAPHSSVVLENAS